MRGGKMPSMFSLKLMINFRETKKTKPLKRGLRLFYAQSYHNMAIVPSPA